MHLLDLFSVAGLFFAIFLKIVSDLLHLAHQDLTVIAGVPFGSSVAVDEAKIAVAGAGARAFFMALFVGRFFLR